MVPPAFQQMTLFPNQALQKSLLIGIVPSMTLSQEAHNVETTSIQRQNAESTLNRLCFNVVCPLGILLDWK